MGDPHGLRRLGGHTVSADPPRDYEEIMDGFCTCPGRRERKHDLCCEWILRGAGLLPAEIRPEDITQQEY